MDYVSKDSVFHSIRQIKEGESNGPCNTQDMYTKFRRKTWEEHSTGNTGVDGK